jgi:hypothetical protein
MSTVGMDDKELLDVYSDDLFSSLGLTTGTGLSRLLDGAITTQSNPLWLRNITH